MAGFAFALCVCVVLVSGCHSLGNSGQEPLASVFIPANTPGQISEMTERVFEENGYTLVKNGVDSLVLERKGSKMNNIAYGDWLDGTPVWVRVKISILPEGGIAHRLVCDAYLVEDKDSAVEEEHRINRLHARPYRKLLEQVASRLHPVGSG